MVGLEEGQHIMEGVCNRANLSHHGQEDKWAGVPILRSRTRPSDLKSPPPDPTSLHHSPEVPSRG